MGDVSMEMFLQVLTSEDECPKHGKNYMGQTIPLPTAYIDNKPVGEYKSRWFCSACLLDQIEKLKAETERLQQKEESYKAAFADGAEGYDWLQKNLPTKYWGVNVVNSAADYIRTLLSRIEGLSSEYSSAQAELIEHLEEKVEQLQAALDGDPNQVVTPEQRSKWRASAVKAGDEIELRVLKCENWICRDLCGNIVNIWMP